jgi:hypothetical protein
MFKQEISLLKDFKKVGPWSGSYDQKKSKFSRLLDDFCKMHGVQKVELLFSKDLESYGECWTEEGKIWLRNFSALTLLHEFKHWLDYSSSDLKNDKVDEWRANYYSTYRFYYVWPERIKLLSELFKEKAVNVEPEDYRVNANLLAMEDLVKGTVRL